MKKIACICLAGALLGASAFAQELKPVTPDYSDYVPLLKAAGVTTEATFVPEGGHGFNMYSEENLQKMIRFLDAARNRTGKSFDVDLAGEILDAFNNTGSAIRKREETHKMAEANRAFSHYRM